MVANPIRKETHMLDIDHIEDLIANSEPLESFELDEYVDQDEIRSLIMQGEDSE